MKRIYLTCLFALSLSAFCKAQWKPQGQGILPDGYGIIDLSVVDENTVWALAYPTMIYLSDVDTIPDAIIIRTVDGGEEWDVYTFSDTAFFCLSAVSDSIAWASVVDEQSNDSYFYQTIDGGESWELKHTLSGINFPVLKFTDKDRGYWTNTGHSGYTNNGGVNWTEYSVVVPGVPNSYFSYISPQNWLEAKGDTLLWGNNNRIFRSVNGGISWQVVHTFSGNREITSIAFDDAGNGLAISDFDVPPVPLSANNFRENTILWKSSDFGETWTTAPTAPFPLSVITHVPSEENTFFAVSGAYHWFDNPQVELSWTSAFTTDGGLTWETIDRDTPYTCIGFASKNAGWIGTVGDFDYGPDKPAVFKWEGIVGSSEKQALESGISISPNPFTDYLHLKSERYQVEFIECFNAQGQRMAMLSAGELNGFDFSNFSSGIYFLQVHTDEGVVTNKVVKN